MKLLIEMVVEYICVEGFEVVDYCVLEIQDNLVVVVYDLMNLLGIVVGMDMVDVDVIVLLVCVQMFLLFVILVVEV